MGSVFWGRPAARNSPGRRTWYISWYSSWALAMAKVERGPVWSPKRRGSMLRTLISVWPWTIHWARYLPAPGPWVMPIDAPLQCQ